MSFLAEYNYISTEAEKGQRSSCNKTQKVNDHSCRYKSNDSTFKFGAKSYKTNLKFSTCLSYNVCSLTLNMYLTCR